MMGHAIKGKKNARRVDLEEKRKNINDEISSLGYGTTSIYHLEELYGKVLSLSAKVKRLEDCREELSSLVQEQEKEIHKMARPSGSPNRIKWGIAAVIAIAVGMFVFARPETVSDRFVLATQPRATATLYTPGEREVFTTIDQNTIPGWIEVTPNASQQGRRIQVFQENPGGNPFVRQNLDGGMWQGDIFRTATPSVTPSPTVTITPSVTPLVPVAYTLTYTPTVAPTVVINQIPFYVEITADILPIYGYASCAGKVKGNVFEHGTYPIVGVTSNNGNDYCGKITDKVYIPLIINGVSFTSWNYGGE